MVYRIHNFKTVKLGTFAIVAPRVFRGKTSFKINTTYKSNCYCALERIRTSDLWYRKPMLYPLSYEGGTEQGYQSGWASLGR